MILFVDDEPLIVALAKTYFGAGGHEVVFAATVADALAAIETHGDRISHAVIDMEMPDGSGWDVCARICERVPGAKVILASGEPLSPAPPGMRGQVTLFLPKPFPMNDLLRMIGEPVGERK